MEPWQHVSRRYWEVAEGSISGPVGSRHGETLGLEAHTQRHTLSNKVTPPDPCPVALLPKDQAFKYMSLWGPIPCDGNVTRHLHAELCRSRRHSFTSSPQSFLYPSTPQIAHPEAVEDTFLSIIEALYRQSTTSRKFCQKRVTAVLVM